jgi:hypothetical protein
MKSGLYVELKCVFMTEVGQRLFNQEIKCKKKCVDRRRSLNGMLLPAVCVNSRAEFGQSRGSFWSTQSVAVLRSGEKA